MQSLPDPALVVLVGPAGSGKSHFALAHYRAAEVVSSDDLRGPVLRPGEMRLARPRGSDEDQKCGIGQGLHGKEVCQEATLLYGSWVARAFSSRAWSRRANTISSSCRSRMTLASVKDDVTR